MKLRVMSDLHTEWDMFTIPSLPEDSESILVLPGDIAVVSGKNRESDVRRLMETWSSQFKAVIYVFGNHECYGSRLPCQIQKTKDLLSDLTNVHLLDAELVHYDGVSFIGGTLWTNFDNFNVISMMNAQQVMSDYRYIKFFDKVRNVYRKLTPKDTAQMHSVQRSKIFDAVTSEKAKGHKVVVVSHHLPSFQCISDHFKKRTKFDVNGAYASELFDMIDETKPDFWFHGHTHDSQDLMLSDTRVICNPRGYVPVEPNPEFDPLLTVEV